MMFFNMKAILISFFVFVAVGALDGSLYGEREDAIEEVEIKFLPIIMACYYAEDAVEGEMQEIEEVAYYQAIEEGKRKKDETDMAVRKEVIEAIRSAIAGGKPIQTIDCIAKVAVEGREYILTTYDTYEEALYEVKSKRDKELELLLHEFILFRAVLEGLLGQIEDDLSRATSDEIKTIKADAFKKADNAEKQVHDLEEKIHKTNLKDLFNKLRNSIGDTFKTVTDNLSKKLQKCLGS